MTGSPHAALEGPLTGRPLAALEDGTALFRDWLAGAGGLSGAGSQWRRFRRDHAAQGGPAPAWGAAAWREAWLAGLAADLPDEDARRRCRVNVRRLAAGEADVVVTGQQPGFLGGPLYTLHKVAAALAAARERTASGRPTVALFWSGDDDDDWQEAFAPRLWDPARRAFLGPVAPGGAASRMVGAVPAAEWARGEAAWLQERAAAGGLAAELAALWEAGVRDGWPWDRLQRRALLRLFAGEDLLVVSGRDGALHGVAGPFYAELWRRRQEIGAAARARGQALVAAGWHAQLAEASLDRPFQREAEGRRLALPVEATAPPEPASVRPGVALRALVQDWLLRPAGVVVGPAEVAYLLQLEPAYELLALPRSPLLPRLFATLAPPAVAAAMSSAARAAGGAAAAGDEGPRDWPAVAERVVAPARDSLVRALREAGGSAAGDAERRAGRLAARWRDQAAALLAREAAAAASAGPAIGGAAAGGPEPPPWVSPPGRRQERTLAVHWAAALWGEPLVAVVVAAAARHFRLGDEGEWRELILPLPEPR